jgi:uncharacterized protein YkwD
MLTALPRIAAAILLSAGLAACGGGGGLPQGLSQTMDTPGAQLNRTDAFNIINQYRVSLGAPPLVDDPSLDASAQAAVTAYAKTGRQTPKPEGTIQIRYSAGYSTFAETFSGWRNAPQDSAALTDKTATRGGLAVTYEAASPYGVYWAMIVG